MTISEAEISYTQPLYSGWIADTTVGGTGILKDMPFQREMKLFLQETNNPRLTNMRVPGRLAHDYAHGAIRRIGVFSSFSSSLDLDLYMKTVGFSFFLNNKEVTLRLLPGYNYKNTRLDLFESTKSDYPEGLEFPAGSTFHLNIKSGENFYHEMKLIESEVKKNAYAEITGIIDMTVSVSREAL